MIAPLSPYARCGTGTTAVEILAIPCGRHHHDARVHSGPGHGPYRRGQFRGHSRFSGGLHLQQDDVSGERSAAALVIAEARRDPDCSEYSIPGPSPRASAP